MKLSNSFIAVKKITSSIPISNFSEDDLNRAAESILKAEGVINPLVLRRKNLQYEVVDGHFEYYAAAKAKEIDSKKGEYIGAYVIEPDNEEILQQQVELLRNRDSNDIKMKKKLEDLTAQVADLTKSVEELKKDLSNKQDKKTSNEVKGMANNSKKSTTTTNTSKKSEAMTGNPKKTESKANKSKKSETTESKAETSKKAESTENKSKKPDYDSMTVPELKDLAKEQKLVGYSKMNKSELIAALTSDKKD